MGGRHKGGAMVVNRLVLSHEEEMIIAMLRDKPRGVSLDEMATTIGPERRWEIAMMLRHLKGLGLIKRKNTSSGHLVVWVLM